MSEPLPLNEAIRDVLAHFSGSDMATSNRQVAEEVRLHYPESFRARGDELAFNDLVSRVRKLRKSRPRAAQTSEQMVFPAMARDLLSKLPVEIPRYPDEREAQSIDDDERDDEVPWGNLLTSTIAEVKRYRDRVVAGIRADTAKLEVLNEVLDMAINGGGVDDGARLCDALSAHASEVG